MPRKNEVAADQVSVLVLSCNGQGGHDAYSRQSGKSRTRTVEDFRKPLIEFCVLEVF